MRETGERAYFCLGAERGLWTDIQRLHWTADGESQRPPSLCGVVSAMRVGSHYGYVRCAACQALVDDPFGTEASA